MFRGCTPDSKTVRKVAIPRTNKKAVSRYTPKRRG
nr:MAG TPA: hypothetical protein [Bacteriophage sp.]